MSERLDYRLSTAAWSAVSAKTPIDGDSSGAAAARRARSRLRSLPSLLRASGLVVTLGFLRSHDANDQWVADALWTLVRGEVASQPQTVEEFLSRTGPIGENPELVAELSLLARIAADHLKRAAEVLLPKPEKGEQ